VTLHPLPEEPRDVRADEEIAPPLQSRSVKRADEKKPEEPPK